MIMFKSRSELVHEAADKLNIVGDGQPLEANYAAKIDGNVDPLLRQLAIDDICLVSNDEYIPAEWFDSLAGLLANVCAPLGGKSYDPQLKQFFEMQLKRLTANTPSYNTLKLQAF